MNKIYENIVVGLDAAGLGSPAVVRGLQLARRFGSHVHVVHAVEVSRGAWLGRPSGELAAMEARAEARARETVLQIVELARREAGFEAGSSEDLLRVDLGHPAEVIQRIADEEEADLVLLGPHEERSLFDFGSTSRAVLARATCPLWMQTVPARPLARILVAVDFSEHSERALEHARALAAATGSSLRALHCFEPHGGVADALPGPEHALEDDRRAARAELERWMEERDWGPVDADSLLVEGRPDERIVAEAEDADLVVLGTHGRTGLFRFLPGSVAYATARRSPKPVLVVPSPKRTWLLPHA